jgi:hypothetical protein
MKKVFSAQVEKDNVKIHEPQMFKDFLLKIGHEERIVVTVQKWYKRYSDKQRNYYFGVPVSILAENLGYTPQEMHDALKVKFLSKQQGKLIKILSITSLSTVQMEDYMANIRQFASAELSCYVPEPNEAPLEYRYTLSDREGGTGFITK